MKQTTRRIALFSFLIWNCANLAYGQVKTDSLRNDQGFSKYRLGGYGEILYQHMDYGADRYNYTNGAQPDKRSLIGMPRTVFSFDYKFRNDLIFSTELEFEHGGTGSAMELEYEEAGEYEMEVEKAGEVVLEQLHFTKIFKPWLKVRVGHMIVPVGQTNARHESILYFGTSRPESENSIIPLTWHETGISILGNYRRWSYQLMLVNGLDANGFTSAYWVREGKQGIFEEVKMTDPATVVRIENTGFRHLRLSASAYIGNSTGNTSKSSDMKKYDGKVGIISGDFEYNNRKLIMRGNIISGDLSDSYQISAINKTLSKNIQYSRTPVAKNALAYGAEAGYSFRLGESGERVIPFVRYEYYNSMEKMASGMHADERYKRDILTFGLNYFIMPSLAIKADYAHRRIGLGNYNNENTFGLALVYTGWMLQK
jgi:hypothetical protein